MATHLKTPFCADGTYSSSGAAGFQIDLQTGPYAEPGWWLLRILESIWVLRAKVARVLQGLIGRFD